MSSSISLMSPFWQAQGASQPSTPFAVTRTIATWSGRLAFRRHLGRLDRTSPHLVTDIGFHPADVAAEIRKPFWRA